MSSCIEKERQALLDVKASLIDLHGNLSDWGTQGEKMDCCKWVGVTCNNHTGHVIKLDLSFGPSAFTGKICPSLQVLNELRNLDLSGINFQSNHLPAFLGSLSKLKHLHISGSNLSGPIPHQLANLSNLLRLDLSFNFLGGPIPKSFGNCSSLVKLDLSHNLLNGPLPGFAGCSSLISLSIAHNSLNGSMPDFTGCSSLHYLDLSGNFLSGIMPVCVGRLSNLGHLDVSHNSLNGSIPNFIGCPSLSYLDMSSNQLSGNVPNSLGHLSNLEYLDFSSNFLEGVISQVHFLNLTQLDYLDLSFNSLALDLSFHGSIPFQLSTIKLQSCKLGPRFPVWIKTQEHFTHLDISNAGISDGVPAWFWDLPKELVFLNISSNEIKGTLPDMKYNFAGYPGIDLSNNRFEGRVPILPSTLATLNLSGNKFSGTLSFLCDLDWLLTFLDLSNNSLSGSLPDCWLNFQERLVILNLSNNNLSGKIPNSLGFLSNLEALYLRTNAFVGELPMSLSNCTKLRFVDFGENKFFGVIPEWIGEKLSKLYVLVLGSNGFKGRLPSQICWLHNLQVLDLSNNGLSGNIPRCFHNFTAMARRSFGDDMTNHSYSSYLRPLFFSLPPALIPRIECGAPTPIACPFPFNEEASFLDNALVTWKGKERCGFPSSPPKKDVEEDEDDSWKSYYTGMGVGFAVGCGGICGALLLNIRCRYFFFASLSHLNDWIYVTVAVHLVKLERKLRRVSLDTKDNMMHVLVSLLLWILFMTGGGLGLKEDTNMISCIEEERQALLDVKARLIGLHQFLDGWGSEREKNGQLQMGGYLSQNLLGGLIPKSFGNCSSLVHLDLSQNLFSSPLPSFAGCSTLTNLSLAHNSLSGSMPDFTQCTSLKYLDISSNLLSGNMPNSVCELSNLEYLDVGHNSFNTSMPDFTQCTSLKYLDLSSKFLSGIMTVGVGQQSNLGHLDVNHNSLNGSIPNFIGYPSLSYLDMSSNQFFGNVPNSLGHLSNLEYLDFSSNFLEGVISEVHFLNLTKLSHLDLSFNSLSHFKHLDISNAGISDGVPSWFWDLPRELAFLNISSNEIKGVLPDLTSSFGGFPGMDLSNNRFEGRVLLLPPTLAALNLSGNKFSGTLSFLCDINRALTFLDLSNNLLSGSLPDCWSNFQEMLVVLSLSNNNLSGEIPSSLGFLSNLEALYLRKKCLCWCTANVLEQLYKTKGIFLGAFITSQLWLEEALEMI
ncbi:hypothetical protein L1987_25084 [Smallanthus sonchifolius]|uniref:Uncharacterized protein n=1 Tax=Smallanthus sonchifolius TaxID=185202 RepID=A0ACB9IM94_9ASTR|nr:hypothetical protein L1987_25084 [Smallanthus sonchifolius]